MLKALFIAALCVLLVVLFNHSRSAFAAENRWFVFVTGSVAATALLYVVQVARRMRETIGFRFKRAVRGLSLYGLVVCVGYATHQRPAPTVVAALLLGLMATWLIRAPRRTRYISFQTRRAVIARDLKHMEFDGSAFHIDHIVPYSKGGDSSVRNLRVIPRKDNLRKGAKMPRLWDVL